MATYALVHGGAHGGSCFDLLAAELRERGHVVVAPDLPIDDAAATLTDHAQVVVDAVDAAGDRDHVVVVAHSLGGLVGPIAAGMLDAELLVMLAAMIPQPGETCVELWANTGYAPAVPSGEGASIEVDLEQGLDDRAAVIGDAGAIAAFYHDVPRELALDAVSKLRPQEAAMMLEPWPLPAWPEVPVRYLLCRDDRILPPEWSRRVARDRLGVTADEIDGSHSPFLARPWPTGSRATAERSRERRPAGASGEGQRDAVRFVGPTGSRRSIRSLERRAGVGVAPRAPGSLGSGRASVRSVAPVMSSSLVAPASSRATGRVPCAGAVRAARSAGRIPRVCSASRIHVRIVCGAGWAASAPLASSARIMGPHRAVLPCWRARATAPAHSLRPAVHRRENSPRSVADRAYGRCMGRRRAASDHAVAAAIGAVTATLRGARTNVRR
jgi:hypothetical protein